MINWKELEKFISPGKVCTLVIMVDGREIGAFSFNIETLAYKEILESKPMEPVKIAEKTAISSDIKKAEAERKESLKAKKGTKPTAQETFDKKADKALDKIEPEPMDEEEAEEEDDDVNNVDEETGEIKEEVNLPSNKPTSEPAVPERRLTRAEIMAQSEEADKDVSDFAKNHVAETNKTAEPIVPQRGSVSAGPEKKPEPEKKVEESKIVDQTFGEEW